jgi:GNAT superfamily N-acetyltransferase
MQSTVDSPVTYEVRRLFLPSETDQIRRMQLAAREFTDHYPRHAEWLEKAIAEILRGERVGFGLHEYSFAKPKRPKVRLVGSIILRENDYSGVIELKNLFIQDSARKRGYGRAIYGTVEQYCRKYGYASIQTEVPCTELTTVAFLHSMGFKVNDCEPSPYRPGEDIYIMSKQLSPLYNGDVFDLRQQAVWLLKNYYRLIDRHADDSQQAYELNVSLGVEAAESAADISQLSGIAVIEEGAISKSDQGPVKLLRESRKHLRFLFATQIASTVQHDLDTHGIKAFDRAAVLAAFGKFFAYSPATFEQDAIAGMIVLFKPELFERVKPDQVSHTYFKGGPTGKYLRAGNNLLLLVEPSATDPTDGICGIATIKSVLVDSAEKVWMAFKDKNPLFTQEEFSRFSAKKSVLVAIEFSDVRRFDPLPTDDLLEKVLNRQVETDELGHHYFDGSSLRRLIEVRPPPLLESSSTVKRYKVALSFAGEDRIHAEQLATLLTASGIAVFYDAHEKAKLWGKNLYQHLQKVYRDDADFCVVFLSEHYRKKLWTKHELEQMQARAFREREEYILPVKLDDTTIPGINETTGYLDLRTTSVQEVFNALQEKLHARA